MASVALPTLFVCLYCYQVVIFIWNIKDSVGSFAKHENRIPEITSTCGRREAVEVMKMKKNLFQKFSLTLLLQDSCGVG